MHESSHARAIEAELAKKGAGGKLISADRNLRRLINGQPIFGLRVLFPPHSRRPRSFFLAFYHGVLYIDHRRRRVMAHAGGSGAGRGGGERGWMTTSVRTTYARLGKYLRGYLHERARLRDSP